MAVKKIVGLSLTKSLDEDLGHIILKVITNNFCLSLFSLSASAENGEWRKVGHKTQICING
jgi:hypothetical protein